jgi:hypothetical protein
MAENKAAITLDLAKYGKTQLPDVSKIKDIHAYINDLGDQELVMINIRVGEKFQTAKRFIVDHAEFVHSLRDRLPARGPNCIAVKDGDDVTTYTWSEFCLEFFGCSDRWVRKIMADLDGAVQDPRCGMDEEAEAPKPPANVIEEIAKVVDDIKEEARGLGVSQEAVMVSKVIVAEADAEEKLTIANNLIQDWDAFLKMTEEYAGNNRLPFPYITYVKEMDKRVRALAAKLVTSVGAAMKTGE